MLYPTNGLSIGAVKEPDFAAALCTAYTNALFHDSVRVLMANSSLGDKRKKKIFDDNPRRFYPALA